MSEDLLSLQRKRVLVTGASSGLGRDFVMALIRQGAQVAAAARRVDALNTLRSELQAEQLDCQVVAMDVTQRDSIEKALDQLQAAWGGLPEVVVNNAGVAPSTRFLDLSEDDWDRTLDTNLKGAFLVSQAMARRWVAAQQPGNIINIASILGLRVSGEVAAYAASKAGLIQFSKSLALDLSRYRIRVNVIAPGYIETDLNRDFFATEAGQRMIKRMPRRALGQVEDLLGPLCLLVSDASKGMTGAVVAVDGGHLVSPL